VNVPVLARIVEAAGIPTVTVSMMPGISQRRGSPRVVGVPFPFGQAFGPVGDDATHRRVVAAALDLVAAAAEPGARVDLDDLVWPVDRKTAYRGWQPPEPSPIVAAMIAARRAGTDEGGR